MRLFEKMSGGITQGYPSFAIFGFFGPMMVLWAIGRPVLAITGMSEDAYAYIFFGLPMLIFVWLSIYGD